MKDLTLNAACIIVIAIAIGLSFHGLYPHVPISPELMGLFAFVAVILKLAASKAWGLLGSKGKTPSTEDVE